MLVGTAWILFSDHIALLIAGDGALLARAQLFKGLGYVVVTAGALFFLVRHQLRELQRSEQAIQVQLRARQRLGVYLETIIEASPSAIFDLDTQGCVAGIWNPAAAMLLGYTRAEVVGTYAVTIPENIRILTETIDSAPEPTWRSCGTETELRCKDGSLVPVLVATAPLVHNGAGEASAVHRTLVMVTDIGDLRRTTDQLEDAVAERDTLLREVHHRVKNNLQLISSLLSIEGHAARCPDADRVVARTRSRIQAFAHIHEQLYQRRDLSRIRVDRYIGAVATETITFYGKSRGIELQTNLDSCETTLETALPMGLIVHESLLTWLEATQGLNQKLLARVTLQEVDGSVELRITGSGEAGVTVDLGTTGAGAGTGLMLVGVLTKQLGGEIVRLADGCSDVHIRLARLKETTTWP